MYHTGAWTLWESWAVFFAGVPRRSSWARIHGSGFRTRRSYQEQEKHCPDVQSLPLKGDVGALPGEGEKHAWLFCVRTRNKEKDGFGAPLLM